MVEKKSTYSLKVKILSLILLGIGILSLLTLFRSIQNNSFIPIVHSWILVATRGYYGNTDSASQLHNFPIYQFELLGDTNYQRSKIEAAIDAYTQAIQIEPNTMIELKLALLIAQSRGSGNSIEATGVANTPIDETISRIEKDASNRGKYFGKGESYSAPYPIFEVRDKEVIDW